MAQQTPLLDSSSPAEGTSSPAIRQCKRIVLALLGAIVLSSEFSGTALLVWFGQEPLESFSPWLKSQETAGIVIFLGVWVAGSVLCLPSTPLWLLGGFCFKQEFLVGLMLNASGCWLGSMVSFGIGAQMARCRLKHTDKAAHHLTRAACISGLRTAGGATLRLLACP